MVKSNKKSADVNSEENEAKPKEITMSDELTRKPLDAYRESKESNLYPNKALQEAEESPEVIEQHAGNTKESILQSVHDNSGEVEMEISENETYGNINKTHRRFKDKPSKEAESSPTPNQPKQKNQSLMVFKILAITVPCLVFIFVTYLLFGNHKIHRDTPALDFDGIISKLKPEFIYQPEMSFRIIRTALKAVNTTEPTAPAIIVLLASKGAELLSQHLGRTLAKAVSENPLTINGKNYEKLDYDTGKKQIDDQLHSLSLDKYEAVIVEDLHLIPGGTALMFHSFWDHENAPYKRVIFVMTVTSESPISSKLSKNWDETVNTQLALAWSDIKEDQRTPLLARATVGVAAITPNNN